MIHDVEPEHWLTMFAIALVGRAALERLYRGAPFEYGGSCRRDLINTWQSAVTYRIAHGGPAWN